MESGGVLSIGRKDLKLNQHLTMYLEKEQDKNKWIGEEQDKVFGVGRVKELNGTYY